MGPHHKAFANYFQKNVNTQGFALGKDLKLTVVDALFTFDRLGSRAVGLIHVKKLRIQNLLEGTTELTNT